MAVGHILIGSETGSERSIYAALREIKEITDARPVFGDDQYAIIAKVEVDDPDIRALWPVVERIRKIPAITATKTLPGIPGYGAKT